MRITKANKISEFYLRIKKIMEIHRMPFDNYENHENSITI